MKKNLIKNWDLRCIRAAEGAVEGLLEKRFSVCVPGDITADMMRYGVIGDVHYADNCLRYRWINASEWCYSTELEITEPMLKNGLLLQFDGIDTYSEIFLNGEKIAETNNMFLPCKIRLNGRARIGKNFVEVRIKPVDEMLVDYGERYSGAFRNDRLTARKAQCHFGWDWAPDFYGMGVYKEVWLIEEGDRNVLGVRVRTRKSGEITFFPEVDYTPRKKEYERFSKDILRIRVFDGDVCVARQEYPVTGYKNICNLKLGDPKLWFPNGYGESFVYTYTVEIIDEVGYTVDIYSGSFGVREVCLDESPIGKDRLDFRVYVNGRKIFLKGSNWVPASFMTGAIEPERYERLLYLAKQSGYNVLRLWGGGIYENDLFYRLCDEYGILVWHDFMFACGTVPDDMDEFCRNVEAEAIYQVKRLDNHPCMLLWNGGNELNQSFAYSKSKLGAHLIDHLLSGICAKSTDVPYYPACPWSYTDWGNDLNSGDCHKCAIFDASINRDEVNYRKYIVKDKPVTTECAGMGPCRMRNLRKFIPEEKLWPINEIWDLHFVDNPYEPKLPPSFARMEKNIAESFFGGVDGVADFVKKAMIAHCDVLVGEIDYARADSKICGGVMNWMYNDIWRNGTWSVVDYELECKPAYYAMKRAFAPVYAGFLERGDGFRVFFANDTSATVSRTLRFGQKRVDGEILFVTEKRIEISADSVIEFAFEGTLSKDPDAYLFAETESERSVCFANGYAGVAFKSDVNAYLGASYEKNGRWYAKITIKANSFAKAVFIDAEETFDLLIGDNYFDMEAGEEKTILLSCKKPFTATDIIVKTFADEWAD